MTQSSSFTSNDAYTLAESVLHQKELDEVLAEVRAAAEKGEVTIAYPPAPRWTVLGALEAMGFEKVTIGGFPRLSWAHRAADTTAEEKKIWGANTIQTSK